MRAAMRGWESAPGLRRFARRNGEITEKLCPLLFYVIFQKQFVKPMSEKEKNPDLDGISFEDTPLDAQALESRDKGEQIARQRRQTMDSQMRIIQKKPIKLRAKTPHEKRVSKRVRYLTDNEIRRYKGIMSKPFKTTPENVLWMILEKGPITVLRIATELNKRPEAISGVVSELFSALGNDGLHLVRRLRSDGRTYEYKAISDFSPESGYRKYRHWKNEAHKKRLEKQDQEGDATAAKKLTNLRGPRKTGEQKEIENAIQESVIRVKVEGSIKILFGIGE